jgi:AraC-like DNA-binding protein/ligand-binding sensor protein
VLQRSKIVRDFEESFRRATGWWVRLVPGNGSGASPVRRSEENPFCTVVATVPEGRQLCAKTEAALCGRVRQELSLQECRCFAGLTVIALPVVARGEYVATLLAGQVLRQKRGPRDLARLSKLLATWGIREPWSQATKAYLDTPVATAEQFQGTAELLTVFAELLGTYAAHHLMVCCPGEQPVVAEAREFVEAHLDEPIGLREVARHLHVSPYHLCKTFKRVTGMTFTECVGRARVDKAKTLLANPFLRVSEVAYTCGFRALPHFNEVFRKYVSKSPTEYRRSLAAH